MNGKVAAPVIVTVNAPNPCAVAELGLLCTSEVKFDPDERQGIFKT